MANCPAKQQVPAELPVSTGSWANVVAGKSKKTDTKSKEAPKPAAAKGLNQQAAARVSTMTTLRKALSKPTAPVKDADKLAATTERPLPAKSAVVTKPIPKTRQPAKDIVAVIEQSDSDSESSAEPLVMDLPKERDGSNKADNKADNGQTSVSQTIEENFKPSQSLFTPEEPVPNTQDFAATVAENDDMHIPHTRSPVITRGRALTAETHHF